jgi:hypothetical protein
MAATIIAVHQVGRRTAIVRRTGNELAGWRLLGHGDDFIEQTSLILDHLAALIQPGDRVAVVGLPTPADLLGHGSHYGDLRRAVLLGALLHDPLTPWAPLLVGPADYGSWHLSGYPGELVGPREQRGAGRLRICRAAWDLAGAALPDGPPALADDLAHAAELATVTVSPPARPGDRDRFRAEIQARCGVCSTSLRDWVLHQDPPDADDPEQAHATFLERHVSLHLEVSGRARNLVTLDTAQAITAVIEAVTA